MKMTMRIGALLLVAALAASCGGGSEPSQSEDDSGSTAVGGNGAGSNNDNAQQDGQDGGKKNNKHDEHEGPGNGGGDKDDPEKVPEGAIVVEVKGNKVSGVEDTVEVAVGDEVILVVGSDKPDEVHVHGYDETDDVGPKERAEIEFTADIPGVFEVELEEAHRLLFELQVQ
jgi:hypothetical protein